ncbi:hypothetical protein [Nocardiopsis lambiniae]|uniref:Uncharacterized protein n=1 Tax=Nocardiopsis lambiniae TaxID=3075539 RepID=A0ABU2M2V9_9ACTN|nr:hypothetical protein [Nocardiopsis sp. DSM 44743]MDT0326937.1 hypothetical protein [Nocardiopsis sp. DSM 44743]
MSHDPPPSHGAPSPGKAGSIGAQVALGLGIGCLGLVVAGSVLTIGGVLLARELGQDLAPSPGVSSEEAPAEPTDGYTAQTLVAELDTLYPLPDARDESSSCVSEDDGCLALVTTDLVSVYEMPDADSAARWAAGAEAGAEAGDARQAGRFVLFWPEDSAQPLLERDKLHTKAIVLVG